MPYLQKAILAQFSRQILGNKMPLLYVEKYFDIYKYEATFFLQQPYKSQKINFQIAQKGKWNQERLIHYY